MNTLFKIILIVLFFNNFLASQTTSSYDTNKQYSQTELLTDFDLVVKYVNAVHPAPNRFTSEEELKNVETEIRNQITDGLTDMEFHSLVRKYVKEIRCGHTVVFPSNDFYKLVSSTDWMIPFYFEILDDELFIKKNLTENEAIKVGTQVCEINNVSVSEIIQEMKAIQELDGFTLSRENSKIRKLFNTYYLFIYGIPKEFELEFCEEQDGMKTVIVAPYQSKKTSNTPPKNDDRIIHSAKNLKLYLHPENSDLAVLDLDAFERKAFKKNHKAIFSALESRNIEHLVIDLRGNGGGYFPNGNHFLRYLISEEISMDFSKRKNKIDKSPQLRIPFYIRMTETLLGVKPDADKNDPNRNYKFPIKPKSKNFFEGQLYVLTDGNSFSMSSFVSAKLNKYTDAIFIGEETGGTEFGSNAILSYSLNLPNTKIRLNLPHFYLNHDVETKEEGRGILPDYEIKYTLEELLAGKDKEMETVIMLIKEGKGK
jgi:hypothetical protein